MAELPEYEAILERVRQLSLAEQRRLVVELATLVEQQEPARKERSILELRGLGKEIRQDIDVDAYIRQEREAWASKDE